MKERLNDLCNFGLAAGLMVYVCLIAQYLAF